MRCGIRGRACRERASSSNRGKVAGVTVMVRFLVIILYCILAVVPSGCLHSPSLQREALEEEGEVYLYLQPFPQEAQRLRFVLTGISALRGDGTRLFPCSLSLG